MKNYYEILGIEEVATPEQIKKAFRINAVKYHPDKNFGDHDSTKKFIEIKEAYDILSSIPLKAEYDIKHKQTFGINYANNVKYERNNNQEDLKQNQKEQKFEQKPYISFYSKYDREQQETEQHPPYQNPWQEKIKVDMDFFKLPKRIGKIFGGYSSLIKGKKKISKLELIETDKKTFLIIVLVTLLISLFHSYLFSDGFSSYQSFISLIYGIIGLMVCLFIT